MGIVGSTRAGTGASSDLGWEDGLRCVQAGVNGSRFCCPVCSAAGACGHEAQGSKLSRTRTPISGQRGDQMQGRSVLPALRMEGLGKLLPGTWGAQRLSLCGLLWVVVVFKHGTTEGRQQFPGWYLQTCYPQGAVLAGAQGPREQG